MLAIAEKRRHAQKRALTLRRGIIVDVTIFTNTGCSACHQAMDFMRRHSVSFVERSLADDPSARDELLAMGFRAVPVIKVGNETMIGFSAPKLRKMLSL